MAISRAKAGDMKALALLWERLALINVGDAVINSQQQQIVELPRGADCRPCTTGGRSLKGAA